MAPSSRRCALAMSAYGALISTPSTAKPHLHPLPCIGHAREREKKRRIPCGLYSLVDELGLDVFDGLLESLKRLPNLVVGELVRLVVAQPSDQKEREAISSADVRQQRFAPNRDILLRGTSSCRILPCNLVGEECLPRNLEPLDAASRPASP